VSATAAQTSSQTADSNGSDVPWLFGPSADFLVSKVLLGKAAMLRLTI